MKCYFAWVDQRDVFSIDTHLVEDEKIFSMQVIEEEGAVPQARIVVQNLVNQEERREHNYCFISTEITSGEVKLLFQGRLVDCPVSLSGETATLDFVALSEEREEKYKDLLSELESSPTWDELFLPLSQRQQPEVGDLLAAQSRLVYWNRTSHDVKLSHFVLGRAHYDLGGNYYRESLKFNLNHSPLERIEVHLHAKWVQRFHGTTRLDHLLHRDLSGGCIETYSGKDLEKRWWRADQQFQQHGYRILESSLATLSNLEKNDSFWVSSSDPVLKNRRSSGSLNSQEPKKLSIKRKAYRPSLKLRWRYIQPRHEEVVFTLNNDLQPLSYKPSKHKILNFTVYDLVAGEQLANWGADLYYKREECIEYKGKVFQAKRSHRSKRNFEEDVVEWEPLGPVQQYPLQKHRGTFFKTDRGRQVIEHALDRAQAYLCASSRCVDISFACHLEQAIDWSCDHTLSLEDERLPGRKAKGKIKKLVLEVDGETGAMKAYITLACCVGTGLQPNVAIEDPREAYGEEGLFEDCLFSKHRETIAGISYCFSQNSEKGNGILHPAMLGASDLLREVTLSYDADAQQTLLRQHQYPLSSNIIHALKGKNTKVQLKLEDLRGRRLEKTTLALNIAGPWSAPKHINLGT